MTARLCAPRRTPGQGRAALLAALAVMLLGGCAFPVVSMQVVPRDLAIVAGDSATVTVSTGAAVCDWRQFPEPCVDVTGQVFDHVVENVPSGVGHRIDTSLQSPSTPGVGRITFETNAAAPPGFYDVAIHATLLGRTLGTAALRLRILPPAALHRAAAAAIEAAGHYSLAVLADGSLHAWGTNTDGELGVGDRTGRGAPTAVPIPVPVRAVAGSRHPVAHSLALGTDGTVWAWGGNFDGQLGLGDRIDRTSPRQVPGLENVESIGAGLFFSLALLADGSVWSWGRAGVLGDGFVSSRSSPGQITGLSGIQAIAAGSGHALALGADGTVRAWGFNIDGQIGDGTAQGQFRPVLVAGLADVVAIAAGADYSLALRSDGTVWSWGRNDRGQLGDGTLERRSSPVRITGLTGVQAIAAGESHALALTEDGRVWIWGETVGNASGDDSVQPVPIVVAGLPNVRAIAAGSSHSLAIVDCGQLWAWGANGHGQLGDGTRMHQPAPMPVPGFGDDSGCARVGLRVSLAGDGDGSVTTMPGPLSCQARACLGIFDRGSAVTLTAGPAAGSAFDGFAIDCDGQDLQTIVVLDRSIHCAARFRQTAVSFLLTVHADGGRVSTTGGGILGPAAIDCAPTCGAIFPEGTHVTLTATDADGFGFTGWSLECAGAERQTSLLMDAPRSCRADFRPFTLAVAVNGEGRVTSDPAGIDCGPTCSYAPRAATAILRAEPALGWQFDGWDGDCTGAGLQTTVLMETDRACTASFSRAVGRFLLTMVVEGPGSVTSVPAGISCPGECVALYAAGTAVDLTAQETPGSMVLNWFDDCAAPGALTNQVVMDADKTCRIRFTDRPATPVAIVTFEPGPHPIGRVITFDGSASHLFDPVTGTQDPSGISLFTWDFENDGTVDVTGPRGAAAIVQYAFQTVGTHTVRLRVRGGPFDETADRLHDVSVVAPVRPVHGLTVQKAGGGTGTITTSPAGVIGCDVGCTVAGPVGLEEDTVITLVARASPGSVFTGWSGTGCTTGAGSVQVTMSADRTCTAGFAPAAPQATLTVEWGEGPVLAFARITGEAPPGNPISCAADGGVCVASFDLDTTVVLRPSSAIFEFGFFARWSGCDAVGPGLTCTIGMSTDRTVTFTIVP